MVRDRFRGAMLGMAVGDALGAQVEFQSRGSFPSQTEMTGGGPWGLKAGEWTDDTIMSMCTAEALVEKGQWDAQAVMENYLRWYRDGHWSPKGRCFDIGGTTSGALRRYEQSGDPYSGLTGEHNQSNGSIMRLAPVPLLYAADPAKAAKMSGLSSKTTHGHRTCIDACRLLGAILAAAVPDARPGDKVDFFRAACDPAIFAAEPLCEAISRLAGGEWRGKPYQAISGSGYAVATLETALWCFSNTRTFEDGLVKTIDVGDDTDTTGAVYGQIAGAWYGAEAIPARWIQPLWKLDRIRGFADDLYRLACDGIRGEE